MQDQKTTVELSDAEIWAMLPRFIKPQNSGWENQHLEVDSPGTDRKKLWYEYPIGKKNTSVGMKRPCNRFYTPRKKVKKKNVSLLIYYKQKKIEWQVTEPQVEQSGLLAKERRCQWCNTINTPEWRSGPDDSL
jgi:hypothetical protein